MGCSRLSIVNVWAICEDRNMDPGRVKHRKTGEGSSTTSAARQKKLPLAQKGAPLAGLYTETISFVFFRRLRAERSRSSSSMLMYRMVGAALSQKDLMYWR